MDAVYRLPYARTWHPSYDAAGGVPALAEVKFSLASNRGCFGECSFCALTFHQGRIVSARSHESLLEEAGVICEEPDFKGYIHDVGGPTANFRAGMRQAVEIGRLPGPPLLTPRAVPRVEGEPRRLRRALRKRALPKVKKVFVRSGIRFDYLMADPDRTFLRELVNHHVSGQLKVAPEHVSDKVLRCMGKPAGTSTIASSRRTRARTRRRAKAVLVPLPLCRRIRDPPSKRLSSLRSTAAIWGYMPEQVQDFYPTPSTISTCMYYTGRSAHDAARLRSPLGAREGAAARSSSIATPQTTISSTRRSCARAGATSSATARSASSGRGNMTGAPPHVIAAPPRVIARSPRRAVLLAGRAAKGSEAGGRKSRGKNAAEPAAGPARREGT